jgi:hypothetical protein
MGSRQLNNLRVPGAMLQEWFPGQPLPINIDLQLVVDGVEWGERLSSRITPTQNIGQGLRQRFRALLGCRVVGLRRAVGGPPAAVDMLTSSLEGWGEDRTETWPTVRARGGGCIPTWA